MDKTFHNRKSINSVSSVEYVGSIVNVLSKMFKAEKGGLMIFDQDSGQLALQKPAFKAQDEVIEQYKVSLISNGNAVRVFNTGEPYFSNDAPHDPLVLQKYVRLYECRNLISVPVKHQQGRLGVLHLMNKKTGKWNQKDVESLTMLSEDFSPFFNFIVDLRNSNGESWIVHKLLTTAVTGGLHAVTCELESLISCPVAILDVALNVLSFSPNIVNINDLVERVKKEFHKKAKAFKHTEDDIINLKSEIVFPITWENSILGYIIIQDEGNNVDKLLGSYKDLVNIFALIIQEKMANLKATIKLRKNVLQKLLDPSTTKQEIMELSSFLGINPMLPYILLVFLVIEQKFIQANFEYIFHEVKNEYEGFFGQQDGFFVMLIPSTAKDNSTIHRIINMINEINGTPVTVGIGRRCCTQNDYLKSFLEAKRACELGLKMGQTINYFDALQFYDLLCNTANTADAKLFVNGILGSIIDYDSKHMMGLLETLVQYLENDGNLRVTANCMNIHINTLRYRLGKIEQLSETSLRNPRDKFKLQFALDVLNFG